jgi:hypothetical protein
MIWCMQRTNIYLADHQSSVLDELARSAGISRAELIRRLIDRAIANDEDDLVDDLSAIDESFGALAFDDDLLPAGRGPDDRARHLERVAGK